MSQKDEAGDIIVHYGDGDKRRCCSAESVGMLVEGLLYGTNKVVATIECADAKKREEILNFFSLTVNKKTGQLKYEEKTTAKYAKWGALIGAILIGGFALAAIIASGGLATPVVIGGITISAGIIDALIVAGAALGGCAAGACVGYITSRKTVVVVSFNDNKIQIAQDVAQKA